MTTLNVMCATRHQRGENGAIVVEAIESASLGAGKSGVSIVSMISIRGMGFS